MTEPLRHLHLTDALSHLAKATQALHDAEAIELRDRAFELAKAVQEASVRPQAVAEGSSRSVWEGGE